MPSVKNIGKPYAGEPHVRFDEGGQARACSLLYPLTLPAPPKALVDGPQAMLLKELPYFLEDVQIAREAYLKRVELRQRLG
ncbi:MAG: hypothetical protein A3F73_12980 [Gallionellales bacterium RIFCSPLOWO2_12_FULL_59_22]|nr:MAG: hypothetical protein A3F73_12980 [Gallionellales bacterium RIFCSPLOWO2_12_FULL_59_22]